MRSVAALHVISLIELGGAAVAVLSLLVLLPFQTDRSSISCRVFWLWLMGIGGIATVRLGGYIDPNFISAVPLYPLDQLLNSPGTSGWREAEPVAVIALGDFIARTYSITLSALLLWGISGATSSRWFYIQGGIACIVTVLFFTLVMESGEMALEVARQTGLDGMYAAKSLPSWTCTAEAAGMLASPSGGGGEAGWVTLPALTMGPAVGLASVMSVIQDMVAIAGGRAQGGGPPPWVTSMLQFNASQFNASAFIHLDGVRPPSVSELAAARALWGDVLPGG